MSPAAKGYALAADKPIYGVNHLAAHVAVDTLEHGPLPEPAIALLVSGGHSSLLRVDNLAGGIVPLGATIDDAAGEAFDKVARLLGLRSRAARRSTGRPATATPASIAFPRGLTATRDLDAHRFDFSFSGLKTAVARWVEARQRAGEPMPVNDVAASVPGGRLRRADRQGDRRLPGQRHRDAGDRRRRRGQLADPVAGRRERAEKYGITVRVPRPGLCTDNGAMVAALGSHLVAAGVAPSALDLPADSAMPLTLVSV